MVAEVIVDIAHSEVDRVFDYLCGDEVCAGMRVTVPFARSVTTRIVMRVKEESELPPEKLKRVLRVLLGLLRRIPIAGAAGKVWKIHAKRPAFSGLKDALIGYFLQHCNQLLLSAVAARLISGPPAA